MTQQDADAALDVVMGIISILEHDLIHSWTQELRIHLHRSHS